MTILQSTIQTLECFLHHMRRTEPFRSASANGIASIFEEVLRHAHTELTKFESLNKRIRDTTLLHSDLLSYVHASSLEQLVQEQKDDNRVIRELSEKATQDSRSIKLITIITSVFFPATVTAVRILGFDSDVAC